MQYSKETAPEGYVLAYTLKSDGAETKFGVTEQLVHCSHCNQDVVTRIDLDPVSQCNYMFTIGVLYCCFTPFMATIIIFFCFQHYKKVRRTHFCPVCNSILGKSKTK